MKKFFKNILKNIMASIIGMLSGIMVYYFIDTNYIQESLINYFSVSQTPKEKADIILGKLHKDAQNTKDYAAREHNTQINNIKPNIVSEEVIDNPSYDQMFDDIDVSVNNQDNVFNQEQDELSQQDDIKKKVIISQDNSAKNHKETLKKLNASLDSLEDNNQLAASETITQKAMPQKFDNTKEKNSFNDVLDPPDKNEKRNNNKNISKNYPTSLKDDSYSLVNEEINQLETTKKNPLLSRETQDINKNIEPADDIWAQEASSPSSMLQKETNVPPKEDTDKEDSGDTNDLMQKESTQNIKSKQTDSDNIVSPNKDPIMGTLKNQLSIPENSIQEYSDAQNKETGIIPSDNIFEQKDNNITASENLSLNDSEKKLQSEKDKNIKNTAINQSESHDDSEADIKFSGKNAICSYEHIINTVGKEETFTLVIKGDGQRPIKMNIKRPLELYQYLNMSLEQVDNYPSEFSVLNHFCTSLTVNKSVIEEY